MFTFAPRLRHMIREGNFYRATIAVTLDLFFRSLSMLLRKCGTKTRMKQNGTISNLCITHLGYPPTTDRHTEVLKVHNMMS